MYCLHDHVPRAKLADSALGAIVTHAEVTLEGRHILAAESGNVMYWSVDDQVVIFKEEQRDILQVAFYEDERHCLVVSKTGAVPDLKARAVSRAFPQGDKNFEFEFPYKQYKNIILTSDNQERKKFLRIPMQKIAIIKIIVAVLHRLRLREAEGDFVRVSRRDGRFLAQVASQVPKL